MARTRISRRVCAQPVNREFFPKQACGGCINIHMEELEALRLCDQEAFSQEEAAKTMGVSRGTFQRILYAARHKTAEALLEGKRITIGGGNYDLAGGQCLAGRCKNCKFKREREI